MTREETEGHHGQERLHEDEEHHHLQAVKDNGIGEIIIHPTTTVREVGMDMTQAEDVVGG